MSDQKPGEPIVLDYAARGTGPLAALSRSGTDIPVRKAGMRLWAFVTLGLYLAAALVVYVPLVVFCFWRKGDHDQAAAFRELKTIEDFDWQFNPSIKKKQIYDLATCRFIRENRSVLILGPPGTGKSYRINDRKNKKQACKEDPK